MRIVAYDGIATISGERRPAEHDGGNSAEPVDEGFAGGRTQELWQRKTREQATMNATVTTGVRSVGLSSLSGSIAI